jgi:hypothetical protein
MTDYSTFWRIHTTQKADYFLDLKNRYYMFLNILHKFVVENCKAKLISFLQASGQDIIFLSSLATYIKENKAYLRPKA